VPFPTSSGSFYFSFFETEEKKEKKRGKEECGLGLRFCAFPAGSRARGGKKGREGHSVGHPLYKNYPRLGITGKGREGKVSVALKSSFEMKKKRGERETANASGASLSTKREEKEGVKKEATYHSSELPFHFLLKGRRKKK